MKKTLYKQLCSTQLLVSAWQKVKAKDSVGGIDGVTLLDFDKNLAKNIEQIKTQLEQKTIKPQPYRQIETPKKDGSTRKLSMLSIADKIVQQAIKILIEPRCEKLFVRNSYAYRPKVSAVTAVRRVFQEALKKVNTQILCLDIDDFFDNIDHEILKSRLLPLIYDEEIIRLIMLYIKMGDVEKSGKWVERTKGIPQGASFSPLLANIYLHSLDQFVLSRNEAYIRYADNFVLIGDNEEGLEKQYTEIENYLQERLKLSLNAPLNTKIVDGFDFMGVYINKRDITISQSKLEQLKSNIQLFEFNEDGLSSKSAKSWLGMINYYAKLIDQKTLEALDCTLVQHLIDTIKSNKCLFLNQTKLSKAFLSIPLLSKKYNEDRKSITTNLVNQFKSVMIGEKIRTTEIQNESLIQYRKLEYQRKEVEQKELIVNKPGAFIGLSNQCVTVKEKGKLVKKLFTSNLSHIIINGDGVTLSSNILSFCMKNKIPIDLFDN